VTRLSRVTTLEADNARTEQQLRQQETRLRELKQIISTVGFGGSSYTSAGMSGPSSGVYDAPVSSFSQSRGSRSDSAGAASQRSSAGAEVGGIGRFSPPWSGRYTAPVATSTAYVTDSGAAAQPRSTSPARRGSADAYNPTYNYHGAGTMSGAAAGRSPATPLRSPSPLPSPTHLHSPVSRQNGSPRRVSFPPSEQVFSVEEEDRGLDNSRLSVDFERALDHVLTSQGPERGQDLHVPVQSAPSRGSVRYAGAAVSNSLGSTLGSGNVGSGFAGSGAVSAFGGGNPPGLTLHTASLHSVDARLSELKAEKERLRKLLMSRVETL
jgi:hypothetical protein